MSEHFAVKRISSELSELQKNPSKSFLALPIENDLFDWHFTIKGPSATVYSEGLYHGRLILPLNYPLKPPKFLMYNQSGRFEVGREICMSNTSFHPDEWQPAWTIRTMLEGLISFFPEETEGAVGALKASDDTRRALALGSWNWSCANCGRIAEIWKTHMEQFGVEETPQEKNIDQREERKEEVKKEEEDKEPGQEEVKNEKNEKNEKSGGNEKDEEKFKHLPNEAEVRRFVDHANSRLHAVEYFIAILLIAMIASQFIR